MGWDFNTGGPRSCTYCAKDTLSDMTGRHSFANGHIGAIFVFSAKVEGEPICKACAAELLRVAAQQLEGR